MATISWPAETRPVTTGRGATPRVVTRPGAAGRKPVRALRVPAFVMALGFALVACGGESGQSGDAPGEGEAAAEEHGATTTGPAGATTATTDADATATTATLTPEQEVIRDYEAAVEAFSAASNPPNPDDPSLADHYTGEGLENVRGNLRGMLNAGAGADNNVEIHPRNVVITADTATLFDCFIDRSQMIDLADDQPLGAPSETTMGFDVRLERIEGVWKIALETQREEPCTPE